VIAADTDGKIEIVNKAALATLGLESLFDITALNTFRPGFGTDILALGAGKQALHKLTVRNKVVYLSVKCTEFKMQEKQLKILSLQDIKREIEIGEIDSWRKLIRVLNHEIRNSISPIVSISGALAKLLSDRIYNPKQLRDLKQEMIDDSVDGLQTIEKRGSNLMKFISGMKNFTELPQPVISKVDVKQLILDNTELYDNDIKKHLVKLEIDIYPQDLILDIDKKLIDQVLINIIRNALEALTQTDKEKAIIIKAYKLGDQIIIEVNDNGPGIIQEEIEKIFIPFFTTKEGGSGIGLSLSRQIMQLHNGGIAVQSIHGRGTTFILSFAL